jgi:hypothetical protein
MNCGIDDSGDCCGKCDYNPIVLIATHERKEITTKNIELLKRQTRVPKIVLVVSNNDEIEYYKELGVTVIHHRNIPLGAKWQAGVNAAAKMNPDPLIILGSDDLLINNYVDMVLDKINEGYDFIGSDAWFTLNVNTGAVYQNSYTNRNQNRPIGSGKAMTLKFLNAINWKVFDASAMKGLDDRSFIQANNIKAKTFIIKTPEILAVKGKWATMNPAEAYLKSPNINVKKADKSILNKFGYV